jgi:hypothetical protein
LFVFFLFGYKKPAFLRISSVYREQGFLFGRGRKASHEHFRMYRRRFQGKTHIKKPSAYALGLANL